MAAQPHLLIYGKYVPHVLKELHASLEHLYSEAIEDNGRDAGQRQEINGQNALGRYSQEAKQKVAVVKSIPH